jgi:alpha,alpha-trehalase
MPEFHPHVLRDYALLADGERGALVSPRGDIVWLCAPRWHSDAVLSSLIGGAGVYAVNPAHTFVWGGYYEEGSLIWRSRWITVEGRNYDYRYAWIRDQVYAGRAAAAAGAFSLLDDATAFISARLHEDGPKLLPAYTVDGGEVPDQRTLDLPGYPGGFDLVGNRVNRQFQLDALGESLLLLAAAGSHDRLDSGERKAAEIAADAIARRWREPDAGIWEIDNQAWTHSRLICVAGLRAAARHCTADPQASDWSGLAGVILADTAKHAVHPSGRWQRSATDPGLDAALLMPPIRGAVPAADPRTAATLRAYLDELTQDGYGYRFRHDERPLGEAEGAFLLCGFVVALALQQQGQALDAARWFERNRAACGSPGLYAEEYDVAERQLRGNLPQAFVHAMLLECAARLASPWDEA